MVTELKFAILFTSEFTIQAKKIVVRVYSRILFLYCGKSNSYIQYSTMFNLQDTSLPTVVIVNTNQTANAMGTIVWDNYFSSPVIVLYT